MTAPAIAPADEAPHAPGPELQWSESCSFWLYDASSSLAGSLRVAVRPNEGMMDAGLHFWIPDGGFVATRHVKAQSGNTERLEVGDARLEIVEPLRRWHVLHDGPAHSLASAAEAGDREAWHRSRVERLIVDLDFEASHAAIGFAETGAGVPSPREGFEQPGTWSGSVWVSGDEYRVHGVGVRERSWGLRDWQAARLARRFSFVVGPDLAVSTVRIEGEDGVELQRGWILRDGRLETLRAVRVSTALDPATMLPQSSGLELEDAEGGVHLVKVDVLASAPMRSARNRRQTLICESLARFEMDGRSGHGMAEHLFQVDGRGAPLSPVE